MELTAPQELTDEQLEKVRCDVEVEIAGRPAGTMTFRFWPEAAPATVRNFLRYAAEGFYDGLGFHRVIGGFMAQGGCPTGTGTGSGPHGTIRGEFSTDPRFRHRRGVLSMARAADPDSASCQFFVCFDDAPFLDGQYAAFGELVAGEEVLDALAAVPTGMGAGGEKSRPEEPCVIRSMRLREED